MSCGRESDRNAYQAHLAHINSSLIAELAPEAGRSGDPSLRLRADGDADVEAGEKLRDFRVSPCPYCGGVLKVSPSHLEERGNYWGFLSTAFLSTFSMFLLLLVLVFLGASKVVDT